MRLVSFTIKNFRSIGRPITIKVPARHLVLVGGNNVGKSNILTALNWVLGSRAAYQMRPDIEDFHDPSQPISITAIVGNISSSDKSGWLMALAPNNNARGALSKAADPEITIELVIPPVEAGAVEPDDEGEPLPTKPTITVSMWGFNVFKKIIETRRGVAQLVNVAAERSVADDLVASQWTPYGQLMKEVLQSAPQYAELQELLAKVNAKIQEAFAQQKVQLLQDAQVVSYVDDISFQLTKTNDPAELLRYLEIVVTEGSRQTVLSRMGSGTQSALIIGMLELVLRSKHSHVRVFAVEDPDAFIHPHGVRRLGGLMRSITDGSGPQVIVSSHAPVLVAQLPPSDLVRIEKDAGSTVAYQSDGTLADPHFARFVNQDTAEMFFARRVVLVEGATERFLIPPVSPLVQLNGRSCDLDRDGISVIEMASKDNVVNYLKILDEFKIEALAVLDLDFLGTSTCRALVAYLRSKGKSVDDSNDASLRRDLLAAGIAVLTQGEIEDYIPLTDVAAIIGQPQSAVQATVSSANKTSTGFKIAFGTSKPLYARQLADYYLSGNPFPTGLTRIIKWVAH